MNRKGVEAAAAPDEDSPEWTEQEIRTARPALSVIADVFGPGVAAALRQGSGRPDKPDPKARHMLRLDPDVVEAYRQEGAGWQARMNEVLRRNMPR